MIGRGEMRIVGRLNGRLSWPNRNLVRERVPHLTRRMVATLLLMMNKSR